MRTDFPRRCRCKHFTGLAAGDTCKAGVAYAAVELGRGTPDASLPCLPHRNPLGAVCASCDLPTPEETAAEEAEMRKRMDGIVTARDAIVKHLGPWKKGTDGARGEIPCPVCSTGALGFTRSGFNGHIHARCSTGGCVAWME